MKTVNNVTLYYCEFCNKKLLRKHAMEKHELHCSMNPANRSACSACAFLKTEELRIDGGHPDYETVYSTRTFFCEKKNIGVYPHKAIKKGLVEKYPEQFENQIKMPTKCDMWNYTKD